MDGGLRNERIHIKSSIKKTHAPKNCIGRNWKGNMERGHNIIPPSEGCFLCMCTAPFSQHKVKRKAQTCRRWCRTLTRGPPGKDWGITTLPIPGSRRGGKRALKPYPCDRIWYEYIVKVDLQFPKNVGQSP